MDQKGREPSACEPRGLSAVGTFPRGAEDRWSPHSDRYPMTPPPALPTCPPSAHAPFRTTNPPAWRHFRRTAHSQDGGVVLLAARLAVSPEVPRLRAAGLGRRCPPGLGACSVGGKPTGYFQKIKGNNSAFKHALDLDCRCYPVLAMRCHPVRQTVAVPSCCFLPSYLSIVTITGVPIGCDYSTVLGHAPSCCRSSLLCYCWNCCNCSLCFSHSRLGRPALASSSRRCLPGGAGRWHGAVGAGLGAALCAVPVVEVRELRWGTCSPAC